MADHPSFISIARIARPRGNRGEVVADLFTDFPERFESLSEVWVETTDRNRERLAIEEYRIHNGRLLLKFDGIDSITDAERLAGAWVQVGAEEAVVLPEGTYFDHDLVGCEIVNGEGTVLGVVKDVLRLSGNSQLVVVGPVGEFMVPAVAEICREISIREKIIRVDLPDGLMDLNE